MPSLHQFDASSQVRLVRAADLFGGASSTMPRMDPLNRLQSICATTFRTLAPPAPANPAAVSEHRAPPRSTIIQALPGSGRRTVAEIELLRVFGEDPKNRALYLLPDNCTDDELALVEARLRRKLGCGELAAESEALSPAGGADAAVPGKGGTSAGPLGGEQLQLLPPGSVPAPSEKSGKQHDVSVTSTSPPSVAVVRVADDVLRLYSAANAKNVKFDFDRHLGQWHFVHNYEPHRGNYSDQQISTASLLVGRPSDVLHMLRAAPEAILANLVLVVLDHAHLSDLGDADPLWSGLDLAPLDQLLAILCRCNGGAGARTNKSGVAVVFPRFLVLSFPFANVQALAKLLDADVLSFDASFAEDRNLDIQLLDTSAPKPGFPGLLSSSSNKVGDFSSTACARRGSNSSEGLLVPSRTHKALDHPKPTRGELNTISRYLSVLEEDRTKTMMLFVPVAPARWADAIKSTIEERVEEKDSRVEYDKGGNLAFDADADEGAFDAASFFALSEEERADIKNISCLDTLTLVEAGIGVLSDAHSAKDRAAVLELYESQKLRILVVATGLARQLALQSPSAVSSGPPGTRPRGITGPRASILIVKLTDTISPIDLQAISALHPPAGLRDGGALLRCVFDSTHSPEAEARAKQILNGKFVLRSGLAERLVGREKGAQEWQVGHAERRKVGGWRPFFSTFV